ncbi:helix-turn-helix domain-containing protein [Micromonospora sp. IBSANI012]|uniref:helix-turn-helix domain-containing protein n=1 Tax=Micromonospora sp. IBSANI012 TaxID=3457761 RepID=UPI0040598F61
MQQQALARAFGCARVVFNDGLRARREARVAGLPDVWDGDLSKRVITQAKRTPERAWLGEVSTVVLQQALAGKKQKSSRWLRATTLAAGRNLRTSSRRERQTIEYHTSVPRAPDDTSGTGGSSDARPIDQSARVSQPGPIQRCCLRNIDSAASR